MTYGPEYPKIQTAFKRDERNVIMPDEWTTDELAYLADTPWRWTEKVDGTNIRVHWNGDSVTVGGRTDRAQLPGPLSEALTSLRDPQLWKTVFPTSDDVTVYGEGYGAGIQSGGVYRQDQALIVFDVRVGEWWLRPEDVQDVCERLGLTWVPFIREATLNEAVAIVRDGLESTWSGAPCEGLVGTPLVELRDRRGDRIITKLKVKDFTDLRRRNGQAQADRHMVWIAQ